MRISAKFGSNNGGERCGRRVGEERWWEEGGVGVLYCTGLSPLVMLNITAGPCYKPAVICSQDITNGS